MAGRYAALLLAAAAVLASGVSAQNGGASRITYSASGTSTLTPAAPPLPPGSVDYLHLRVQIIGRDVISKRPALEAALKSSLAEAAPAGIAVRAGAYFTYPATSADYAQFSSIIYDADLWNIRTVYPDVETAIMQDKATSTQTIYGAINFIQQSVQSQFDNMTELMLSERDYVKTEQQQQDEKADPTPDKVPFWANTLSRIQLTGTELNPFTADKATAFSAAVYNALGNETVIYSVNVSDFTAVDTPLRVRKLLQPANPTVIVNVWTNSRAANFTPSVFWDSVFESGALDAVGPLKAKWTGTFVNATVQLRNINETTVGTVLDLPATNTAGADGPSAGESAALSASAIAGIVVAALIVAAALIAAAIVLVYKSKRGTLLKRQDAKHVAVAAASTESSFDSSDDAGVSKAAAISGLNFAGVSQTLAAGVPQLEQLLAGCADHKPPLRKADIEFRTKASGERIVLGGGAFSTVYRGRHLHRDVAIKVLQLEAGLMHAVQREVQLAERVSRDANVVQFYGATAAADGQSVMLVMELMQGGDLRAALDGPQGAQYLWRNRGEGLAADIARGLAYIHTTGVVHRDLKSSNVLLTAGGDTAKVADIGAAAMMDAEYVSQHLGTLAWAAPELLMADIHSQLDDKADSYSLGVVLWELVTGETPTRGSMRPVRVPEECPADVAALIAQCMAAAPADRPSAADIGQRLQLLAAGPRT